MRLRLSPSWVCHLCSVCPAEYLLCHHPHLPHLLYHWTCKIAPSVSNSIQHYLNSFFGLCSCPSHILSISVIFHLLPNRWLCGCNLLSCHSGFSLHIILDPLLCNIVAQKVCLLSFLHCNFFLDCKLHNALLARTVSAAKLLLTSFFWRCHYVDCIFDFPDLPDRSGESSVCEHWLLYFMLTLLLGEMSDVARYGRSGGKLHLLCQG